MLSTYIQEQKDPIIGYETDGTPVTASAFLEQAETAIAEAKTGKGTQLKN